MSDGSEGVLHIPQSSSITGAWPSDCLLSYPKHSLGVGSYLSVEMQLMYSIAPTDRACKFCIPEYEKHDTSDYKFKKSSFIKGKCNKLRFVTKLDENLMQNLLSKSHFLKSVKLFPVEIENGIFLKVEKKCIWFNFGSWWKYGCKFPNEVFLFLSLFGFYGISTFVGYLMPNPFIYKWTVLFQTIQFSVNTVSMSKTALYQTIQFSISRQFTCQYSSISSSAV